jgi:hypothetical protein
MYTLNRTPPVRGWTRAKARCPYRPFLERFEDRLVPANTPPILAPISNQLVNEGSLLSLTATASDTDIPRQTLRFSLVTAPSGATISSTTGLFRWTPTEAQGPGTFNVTIRVTDNGSPSLSDQKSFTVTVNEVNRAPVLAAISNQTVNEGSLLALTVSATDPDLPANTLSYSLVTAPSGATLDPTTGAFRWTPTEAQGPGTYTVTVRATDNGSPNLSSQRSFTVTVREVNQPPVLNPISDRTVDEQTLLSFTVSATDPDLPANTLRYSLVTAPSGATLSSTTGLFRWTPTEAQGPGTYTITVRVTDNGSPSMSDQKSFTVTVNEVNRPPVLAAISNKTVDEQTLLAFTVSATDPDLPANTLRYSLLTAPSGVTLDPTTGAFRWTPTEAQGPGTYTVTVRVTDSGSPSLSDQKSFTVTVREVNQPPVLNPISDQTVNEGSLLSFRVSATDADLPANALRYSLVTAPGGATLDPNTGLFGWTPTEAQGPESYTITVRVTDDGSPNLSDQKSFTVTVREVNQAPVLAAIADQFIFLGGTVALDVTALDADLPAQELRYRLLAGPAGASLDARTGAFRWSPAFPQGPGVYQVTVAVSDGGAEVLESFTIRVAQVLPPSAFANALAAPEDRPIPGFTSLKAVPEGRFLPVSVSPLSFGTYVGGDEAGRYAHVAGQVFEDLNSDGDQNSDERGLEGTLVILSRMRGDAFVPLASTRTDANGRFTFADVEPGQYRVWPVLPGKMELSPGSGVRAVTVQVAERVGEVNFGAVPRGTVFLTPHVEPPQPQAPTMDKDSPWEGTDGLSCLPAADSPQVWGEPRLWEQAMLAALASGGIGVRSNQDAADGGRNRKDETPPTTRA